MLTALAEGDSSWVRRNVAGNPNATIFLLTSLFEADQAPVRRRAKNPKTPDKVPVTRVAEDNQSPSDKTQENAAQGLIELARLFNDLEDPEFHELPEGEWEAKNNRDKNGFPLR